MIGGAGRVGLVVQIDLELAGCVFGTCGADGDVLHFCRLAERGVEGAVAVEIVDRIDGVVALADAAARIERRQRRAIGIAGAVDEIEFELQRDDRREVEIGEALEHVLQRRPRFAGGG